MDSSLNISILNFCYSSNPKMAEVNRGDIQKLFNAKADYSRSVAEQVKTIMNVSFRHTVTKKVISNNPVEGVNLSKEVLKLMGHAKEIIAINTYGDNTNIIADGVSEIEAYIIEVLPDPEEEQRVKQELLEIVLDVSEYLPDIV